VLPFDPFGNDERQYCSPGIDLPVGRLTRTPDRMFAEYHTSADDLTFITPQSLADSLAALLEIVGVIEHDRSYRSTCPMGEPHLAGRRLQWQIGGSMSPDELSRAVAWTLNLSDGDHTLLDVAERASLPFRVIARAASLLVPAARDRS
jgi:aminopeptidase-like protein